MQTHRILSRVAFERKVSCVSRSGTNRALEADHLALVSRDNELLQGPRQASLVGSALSSGPNPMPEHSAVL